MMTIKRYRGAMEPLTSKPAYHHPIPWQVVTALVLLGLAAASYAIQSAALWIAHLLPATAQQHRLLLASAIATAFGAAVAVAVGVCIAARLDWARKVALAFNLLGIMQAVAVLGTVGAFGEIGVPVLAGGAQASILFALLFLLSSAAAKTYTYKGGGGTWPDD